MWQLLEGRTNLSKGSGPVVHHRAGVVLGAEVVDLAQVVPVEVVNDEAILLLEEVVLHPGHDVLPVYLHILVPVRSALLVPEPGSVHQFVHHNSWGTGRRSPIHGEMRGCTCVDTAVAEADCLPAACAADAGAAATPLHDVDVRLL